MDFLTRIRRNGVTARLPAWMRSAAYSLMGRQRIDIGLWEAEYAYVLANSRPIDIKHELKLGIIKDITLKHSYYEAACKELGVPYELIDISGGDWIELINNTDCAAFLARPFVLTTKGKEMYDERLRILEEDMGKYVFPFAKALWLYESKRRNADWLTANNVSTPLTWVIYDEEKAFLFAKECSLPVVFKTDIGSEALGVRIVRDRAELINLVRKCFGSGYLTSRQDRRDRQWGSIILQEYIHNAREWRVVRIGDSFFAHRKGKVGDFHSGSKIIEYDEPPARLLGFVRDLTDKGDFKSMAIDILEAEEGDYYVIELHAYFGCNQPNVMEVDGKPGRYLYSEESNEWIFEEGEFNRNASCNLRVEYLLDTLNQERDL